MCILEYLSVSGVINSLGVLPRYSYEYINSASHMLAKQCFFSSSHLWGEAIKKSIGSYIHLCTLNSIPVSELREPKECLCILYLLSYEFLNHISGVHINSTYSHDLLSVSLSQLSKKVSDKRVQLGHLHIRVIRYIIVPVTH